MRRMCRWMIVLALAVLLCGSALAAAPTFTDSDRIENTGAVGMLCDLGIISGYGDGSFQPTGTVSRQAAAKMVALMLTDRPRASGSVRFSDVAADSQFAQAIYFCAARGILSGSGGEFRPTEPVTARALAKMLLGALGYDSSRYVGAGWADRVDADARSIGIYDGFYDYYDQPITRDNACLLMFNALSCCAVRGYGADGQAQYYLDELMNPQTLLEYRYGVVRYAELLVANEYASLTETDGHLDAGYSQLEHHRALAVSTGLEMLGRNIVLYAKDGRVIGVPTYSPYEGYYTFEDFFDLAQVFSRVGMTIDESTKFYYNYNEADRLAMVRAGDGAEITIVDHTGDGVIDLVLVVDYREAAVVSAEGGAIAAQFDEGDPFPVTMTDGSQPQAGDTVRAAWIGGRWLAKMK